MGCGLSPEDREYFEQLLKKAESYAEDDPIVRQLDGQRDRDRMLATIAKKILDEQKTDEAKEPRHER